ncbi:MAG: ribosome maturation factor RimP [Gemmatimonadales bacterium]
MTAPLLFFSGFLVAFLPDLEQQTAARLAELGLELVELRQGGSARRPLLQVRIERLDAGGDRRVTVDDCAVASRALEGWLDGTGLGGGQYVLEVSSPGLDRPLRRPDEWRRFAGRQAEVLVPALGGRFPVRIVQVVEDPEPSVELEFSKGVLRTVKLAEIKEARLAVEW